jgi:hypothetical protein
MSVTTMNRIIKIQTSPGRRAMKIRTDLKIHGRFPKHRQFDEGNQITGHHPTSQPTLFPAVRTHST